MKRTEYCGAFTEAYIGQTATAMGWVQTKRDMGGVIFIDLKDRAGTLQVVFNAKYFSAEAYAAVEGMRNQSVVAVTGEICLRDEETYNPRLATGSIELRAKSFEVLSQARTLPFSLEEGVHVREDLRMQYRFLDLRRPAMQEALRFRHRVARATRDYLDAKDFLEVETPILTKSTPEGARDYLVPSRVHPGMFYALPQSPQIFKQLLMVGGVDKYYQIARCFRDEDLRADRQPEFTQVDMELSFVDQEDILAHLEGMFTHIYTQCMGEPLQKPFLRLTWRQAMDLYGSDKPDLRFDLSIVDVTELAEQSDFSVFRAAVQMGGRVRAINAKGCAHFSRGTIDELTQKAVSLGAKGMAWILLRADGELNTILTKYFTPEQMQALLDRMDARPGDFVLFCAGALPTVRRVLGGLRLALADMTGLRKKGDFQFAFVTDFPQFEYSEEEGRFLAMHHPFTMPYEEDLPYLLTDPARVRAQAYDVVLNGVELGSGSIRIHRSDVQQQMFRALGFDDDEIRERFGFMVDAFQYGTPPHGGFAFGLDRLVMLLLGADSLRDVVAFPKTKDAVCLMTGAPGRVDTAQLSILHLGMDAEGKQMVQDRKKAAPRIDVKGVARLARLRLEAEAQAGMTAELKNILMFANQLAELDTENVQPTAHTVPLKNVMREDEPAVVRLSRQNLLANAPSAEQGCIHVPRVVE